MARQKKTNFENKMETMNRELSKIITDNTDLFNVKRLANEILLYFACYLSAKDADKDIQELYEYIKNNIGQFFLNLENCSQDIDKFEIIYILIKSLFNLKKGFEEEKKKIEEEHMRLVRETAEGTIAWLIEPTNLMPEVWQYRKDHNISKWKHMPYERVGERENAKN